MTTSLWLRKPIHPSPDMITDVLIIGGGYAGLSTAYWLKEHRPELEITVIERNSLGAGASGRNAGFLTKGSASFFKALAQKWGEESALKIYRFARESLELAAKHILATSKDVTYESSSSLTLFQTEAQCNTWKSEGFEAQKFDFHWKAQASLSQPLQRNFFGAYENSPEYPVNPAELLAVLKEKLLSKKIKIIEGTSAFQITPDGVDTETMRIKASQVVLALNGYFPQFHSAFKNLIIPRRAQMLAVKVNQSFDCPGLHYDPPERVYWRKVTKDTLVIGGKRLLDEAGEVGDFEKVSPLIQAGLESYLKDQLDLKYEVLNRWSGTMGFTEHELPFIERVTAPLETYIIGGFSGHGMGLGFRSGKDLAELMTRQIPHSFFSGFKETKVHL